MEYIEREIDKVLLQWKNQLHHKPLLIRGARQVGKTYAIRHLAKQFEYYVEIDLNEHYDFHVLFQQGLSPQQIAEQLSVLVNIPIVEKKTLLFLDEIQACPEAINALRYFYEKYPGLHVIAAGSLLEFTLAELPSFGVGRVQSIFMYPFCFNEFLRATGNASLCTAIKNASPQYPLSQPVHEKARQLLRQFLLLGGMPEVVATYVETQNIRECQQVLDTLIVSYTDDFKKYRKRANPILLQKALYAVAEQNTGKFVYSHVDRESRVDVIKEAVNMLCMAGLIIPVTHTSGNGIPLGAEMNEKYRKMLLFDTGIMQRLLHLEVANILLASDMDIINRGILAEVFVGLEIVKSQSCFLPASLFYWRREEKNAVAEVDYLIERNNAVCPIEVKAGAKGAMKSMRMFMQLKQIARGVRTSMENFAQLADADIYPLYAIANLFPASTI
ncbi:MAG: ATP-binding protein [Bacteroidales bacterium]|nr:ATP-binding protein [Bacteroidales bacterium]